MAKVKDILSVQNTLYKYACYLTENKEDAFDLLQDTNERILKSKIADQSGYTSWCSKIMLNIFIDQKRKEGRRVKLTYPEKLKTKEVTEDNNIEHEIKELRKAILSLPPERRAVTLLIFRGWLYREVAEHLEKGIGSVKRYYHQAKKDLKTRLN